MTDNVAILAGYTEECVAYGNAYALRLLVQKDESFENPFYAWDMDEQEYLLITSPWLWTFEPVNNNPQHH